jgi:hypothetical protein
MYTGPERRRRDLPGRVSRATWPARQAIGGFVEGLPCTVIGHKWVEIPIAKRRSQFSDPRLVRFRCPRCGMITEA